GFGEHPHPGGVEVAAGRLEALQPLPGEPPPDGIHAMAPRIIREYLLEGTCAPRALQQCTKIIVIMPPALPETPRVEQIAKRIDAPPDRHTGARAEQWKACPRRPHDASLAVAVSRMRDSTAKE